jgi:hypothetical protein
MSKITATKDGKTKQFTQIQWDLMPANKYGWVAKGYEAPEKTAQSSDNTKSIPLPEKKVSIETPKEAVKAPSKEPAVIDEEPKPKAKAKAKSKK